MKNSIHIKHFLAILFLLGYCEATLMAQSTNSKTVSISLPTLAVIDIEPAGSISLSFTAPAVAGNPVIPPTANLSKWINYSSAIAPGAATRNISAAISSTIAGLDILLSAAPATGAGGGALGTPTGQIILSTTAGAIISGIGGAYTGDGPNNGHQLTISILPSFKNYAQIKAKVYPPVQIIYTISAD